MSREKVEVPQTFSMSGAIVRFSDGPDDLRIRCALQINKIVVFRKDPVSSDLLQCDIIFECKDCRVRAWDEFSRSDFLEFLDTVRQLSDGKCKTVKIKGIEGGIQLAIQYRGVAKWRCVCTLGDPFIGWSQRPVFVLEQYARRRAYELRAGFLMDRTMLNVVVSDVEGLRVQLADRSPA